MEYERELQKPYRFSHFEVAAIFALGFALGTVFAAKRN